MNKMSSKLIEHAETLDKDSQKETIDLLVSAASFIDRRMHLCFEALKALKIFDSPDIDEFLMVDELDEVNTLCLATVTLFKHFSYLEKIYLAVRKLDRKAIESSIYEYEMMKQKLSDN